MTIFVSTLPWNPGLLVPKGMEKIAANSANTSVFLLSHSQQREHTECGGNLFVM